MKDLYQITASIVLYHNDRNELKRTIDSFLNTTLDVRLYLIDNSTTNELSNISTDNRVSYIFNNSNLGFGKAHNIVHREIINKSSYHLILNPDIYFNTGVLESIVKFMDGNLSVGLLVPKVRFPDGSDQYLCKLLPTPVDLIVRKFIPIPYFVKKLTQRYTLQNADYSKLMEVPSLSGCFMFIRTEVLENIGGFDERFFMYCEDIDFSRRIHLKYKTVYYPEVEIYHEFHRDSYKNFRLLKIHIQSAILYFNKWGWFFDFQRMKINKAALNRIFN